MTNKLTKMLKTVEKCLMSLVTSISTRKLKKIFYSNVKESKKNIKGRVPPSWSPVAASTPSEPAQRRCPVRGCDSSGHLGKLYSIILTSH